MARYSLGLGLCLLVASVSAIPVDNNVEGEPEVECGPTSITGILMLLICLLLG